MAATSDPFESLRWILFFLLAIPIGIIRAIFGGLFGKG